MKHSETSSAKLLCGVTSKSQFFWLKTSAVYLPIQFAPAENVILFYANVMTLKKMMMD